MPFGEAREHLVDAFLVAGAPAVAGLGQFVGISGTLDAVANVGIGVVAQPIRRLRDVRVGVVDDPVGDRPSNILFDPGDRDRIVSRSPTWSTR